MRNSKRLWVALILLGLSGIAAYGFPLPDGSKNEWTAGYPKSGPANSGKILVKGKATCSCTFTGNGSAVAWPVGGGGQTIAAVAVAADGSWGEVAITGLTSGTTYNVLVQVSVKCGKDTYQLTTDPKTATAG
jgi:hypothetical protein